jgi:hypothetical protein
MGLNRGWPSPGAARGPLGLRLIAVLLLNACGGTGLTPANPPPPPPPPDNTRSVALQAGDGQRARTNRPVPVPPAIKVTNQSGSGVAGISVTFAIGLGGGTVTSATQTTGSDGIAAVGGWTLGAVGQNTLVATVAGATSGSPVTFSATADEDLVELSRDTTISGVITGTRFVVRAGATVTVGDSLNVKTDGPIEVSGTIRGSCVPVTLESGGGLAITGTVDNSCPVPSGPAPKLVLIGRGGYEISNGTLRAPGDVDITNDPSLVDADFEPQASLRTNGPLASATPVCTIANANLTANPQAATAGANGTQLGGRGQDGGHWRSSCRGDILVLGNVTFLGQEGGVGGAADHRPAFGGASAEGGQGGNGGRFTLRSTGDMVITGPMTLEGGQGGFGGQAIAIAGPDGGPFAADAFAAGGDGGAPGLFALRARSNISFANQVKLIVGNAGDGGSARAEGGLGADAASATSPAQEGGRGRANGGDGGSAPPQTLTARGLAILGIGNAIVSGGNGGFGGTAHAKGGDGGKGIQSVPDGAKGGSVNAFGGDGGNAPLLDHRGQLFGTGGTGAMARIEGGNGGKGYEGCTSVTMVASGGSGGAGGFLQGRGGSGGTGLTAGPDGGTIMNGAGNGGKGGNGFPNAGQGGTAGTEGAIPANVVRSASRIRGMDGLPCVRVQPLTIQIAYQVPVGTCLVNPNPSGSFTVISVLPNVVSFTGKIVNLQGASGILLQVDPGSFFPRGPVVDRLLTPNGSLTVFYFFDSCVARDGGGSFTAEIQVDVPLGTGTATLKIPITGIASAPGPAAAVIGGSGKP